MDIIGFIKGLFVKNEPDKRIEITEELLKDVKDFIDSNCYHVERFYQSAPDQKPGAQLYKIDPGSLREYIQENKAPSFSESVLQLIKAKGLKESEVYRRAHINRRVFSKLRLNSDYQPSKATAIALALAMSLNMKETNELIGAAGYVLSKSSKFDTIIAFCIKREIFNILDVNEILEYMEQDVLPIA